MSVTRLAFRYRLVVYMLTAFLLALGVVGLARMPRREDPDFKGRVAQVIAVYPGARAVQVEQLVADPLVRVLQEVDDVDKIITTCQPGLAVIQVEAAERMSGTLDKLMDDLRKRVSDARSSLPPGVLDVAVNDRFADTAALILGVTRKDATMPEIAQSARMLRDRLRELPEAGEVHLMGEQAETIRVSLSFRRMAELGPAVTVPGIAEAIQRRQILPLSGGSLPLGQDRLSLSPSGEMHGLAELERLVVGSGPNSPIFLRDVARVSRGLQDPPPFLLRVNGQAAVGVTLTMRKGKRITDLGERAQRAMADLQPQLPPGTAVHVLNNLPRSVENRVGGFFHELELAVLIILVLMLLFMGVRSALLVGAMLPVSMMGTFAAMYAAGLDIQQMSIAALILSLALVVDNSIVVLDNIEEGLQAGRSPEEAAVRGTDEILAPMVTANLVASLSFLPLAFMPGGIGDFIRDLGLVTTLSLVVSVALNTTLMPLLCCAFLRPTHAHGRVQVALDHMLKGLREGLAVLARRGLRVPRRTLSFALVAMVMAVSLVPFLGKQFFPPAERDQFVMDIWLPEGKDVRTTEAAVRKVEARLAAVQGVVNHVAYIGQGGPRFYYNVTPESRSANYAQVVVNTVSLDATDGMVGPLQAALDRAVPEARITVKKLEQGPPVGAPVAIRLSGESVPLLRQAAETLKGALREIRGSHSVRDDFGERPLELRLRVDEDRAASLGLSSATIAEAASLGLSGRTVGLWREEDRKLPIELRLDAQERDSSDDVLSLHLPASGGAVPLSQVASLSLEPEDARIKRRQGMRTITVLAYTDGSRLPSALLSDLQARLPGLALPPGVRVAFGGETEESARTFSNMMAVYAGAYLFIVVILTIHFNSFSVVGAIVAAIPMGVIGALPGLLLSGQNLGFMALLGIAALSGVITNHTIFLFTYAQAEGMGETRIEALVEAGRRRIRPILLTVLLSVGALLPQALSRSKLWPPLDWAIIAGLLVSMILTLVVVPSAYVLFQQLEERFQGEGARA